MGFLLNLIGGRILMYLVFALGIGVAVAGWSAKMYYNGYKSGKQSVISKLEKIDAENIKKAQLARDRAAESGSFDRLRKQYSRNK